MLMVYLQLRKGWHLLAGRLLRVIACISSLHETNQR